MHDHLDGTEDILNKIGVFVYHGGKLNMNTWIFTHMEKFLFHEECFTNMEKLKEVSLSHLCNS